ncbi:MAG: hypothetical protein ABI042_04250 [Verrucomicrobiota bacterium]
MKKLILIGTSFLGLVNSLRADTITLWNFNSPTNDAIFTTGTLAPAIGSGTITNVGGTTNSIGGPPSGQLATSDTNTTDNSALRLGQFPAQGTATRTAGMQFFTSTVGYEAIQVTFDQENSGSASLYWRSQYTTNGGTAWIDYTGFQAAGTTAWIKGRIVDFSTVAGVKNNPDFGFRYVSEWIIDATGSGASSYAGNAATYSTGGTLWFDMVTVSGTILSTNNVDPTISSISNQTVRANQTVGPLAFTIGDVETAPANLTLSFASSNPGLISNFSFGGSGTSRTITLTPAANQSGSSTITVTVTDEGGKAASSLFSVTVLAPSIIVSNQTMKVNTSRTIGLQISQYDSFQGAVTVTADSVVASLLPPGSLVLSGSGSNRSLTITPAPNELGIAVITIMATDGPLSASGTIFLNVVDTNIVALWNFNSPLRDFNVQTGSTNSNFGNGIATPLVALGTFGTAGTTSDLDGEDNSRLRLGTFPAQNTGEKTGGVEFRFSTVGFQDINFSWEHYNSASASRYWRVQYTTDGANFIDALSYSNVVPTTFFATNTSFAGISGVNNNPNFAVRIVSEFESSVVPDSTNGYVGVQASGGYSTAGTLWLDTIQFTGAPFTGVTQATLTVSRSGNNILVSWPSTISGTLQQTSTLSPANWQPVSETPVVQNGQNVVTITNPVGNNFYRLSQ